MNYLCKLFIVVSFKSWCRAPWGWYKWCRNK